MLKDRILKLKQDTTVLTCNPILDEFDMDECDILDELCPSNSYINSKVNDCLNYLKNLSVHFEDSYISAFSSYIEAMTYLELIKKFDVVRITETTVPTPDFKIIDKENKLEIFAEVKSLSYFDGILNYHEVQETALQNQIISTEKIQAGEKIVSTLTEYTPFKKRNSTKRNTSSLYIIESIIDKINNLYKHEQFANPDTILIVDLKLFSGYFLSIENVSAFFYENTPDQIASGTLWNIAFGKNGNLILKPIKVEGEKNIDGILSKNGILVEYNNIKGLIFILYGHSKERICVGFTRYKEQDNKPFQFISEICKYFNDDFNTMAWEYLHIK